jgi:dipeptidyl aminopeptidase/acylaminoacyl peptidase
MTNTRLPPDQFLDALLTLPRLFGGSVSPDGKWVAWMWSGIALTTDVYAVRTDGALPPIQLTDTAENSYFIAWTPDSESLIVAQDIGGNERDQLFQINLAQPGVLHPLTEPNPNYFIRGGQLHPNGKWLIYGANIDPDTGDEIEPTLIYRHDLATDQRTVLARPQKGGYIVPRLNPTGTHILYHRKDLHPSGLQLWLVGIDGEDDHEIVNLGADKKVLAQWFPDGQRILLRAETDTHYKIGIYDLPTRSTRWLIDDPERNFEHAFVPHGSTLAVLHEVRETGVHASLLNPDTGEETRFPAISGNLRPLAPVEGEAWVGLYYASRQITDVVRFSLLNFKPESFQSLTRVHERSRIGASDLVQAEDFRWKSVDGLGIQGWLYRAAAPARGTIVYVHGGPTWHHEDKFDQEIQFFVSQGFNIFDPNYRGSTGFSRTFTEAIKEDGWGGREQDDIRTGIEALIAAGIAEKGKVGITGTSYGGYSSWCAITRFSPDILAAAAPICGMTDLVVDYHTTRPDLRPYSEEMMGGTPDQIPEKYHQRSPINFVSNIKGRLLIVQGLQDPNVTPDNVRAVKTALDQSGIEFQMLTFDDEGHGIGRSQNLKTLYTHLSEFFSGAFSGQ